MRGIALNEHVTPKRPASFQDVRWVLIAALEGEAAVTVPPFDAITFQLADLWAD